MEIIILICVDCFLCGIVVPLAYKRLKEYKEEKKKNLSISNYLRLKKEEQALVELEEKEEREKKWDVVYILKNDIDDRPRELIYSLRSLKNFSYDKVWFVGGQPKGLIPDRSFPLKQQGKDKWEKVIYSLRALCQNEDISENFWLFNDDFFIMHPHEQHPAYYDHDLAFRILTLEDLRGRITYSKMLRKCLFFLEKNNLPTKNYAVHIPMLINKTKALEVIDKFPLVKNFRNIYGNYFELEAIKCPDVKYSDNSREIDTNSNFLSTHERSFGSGKIGKYIRAQFPEPSRFEK